MGIAKKFYGVAAGLVIATGVLVGALSMTGASADAMTITDRQDCGYTDPIINCGATSTDKLLAAYDNNSDGRSPANRDIQAIFHHYGVTRSELTNTSQIKHGWLDHTTGNIIVDGKVVGTNAQSLYRVKVSGKSLSPVSIGGKTYYIGSVAGQYSKGADVYVFYKNGQAYTAIQASCGNPIPFTPKEEPKPVYACESLKITNKKSRLEYEFAATASATNATVKSYTFNFGDGTSKVVTTDALTASTSHTFADKAGTYVVSVTVTMSDGKTTTSENCKVTVTIEEKPSEKNPSIDVIKTVNGKEHVKVGVNTEFTYEITVRNTGNVFLRNVVVTDKAPKEVQLLSASAGTISGNEWKHTISELSIGESKHFTVKAKYAKYANGIHKNTVCVDAPEVEGNPDDCDDATTETKELIEVCDLNDNTVKTIEKSKFDESHMTTDLSKCGNMEVCIIEDKVIKTIVKNEYNETTMTTDYSKCETAEVPPELPKTGLETFLGGSLGIGSITAAGYYWVASRRNLLSALLNR